MAKLLRSLLDRTALRRENLVSRHDPYSCMQRLLQGHAITGIVDAGASDGHIARRLVRMFPGATCYLFEPNADYTAGLATLAAEDDRFRPVAAALTEREDDRELIVTEARGPTSLFSPTARARATYGDDVRVKEKRRVPAVTLDGWATREGVGPIQLIKLDIQAGELAALRGGRTMLREHVHLVYTEVFFNAIYEGGAVFSEIDLALRECGLVLYNYFGLYSDENDVLAHGNAIYVHPDRVQV